MMSSSEVITLYLRQFTNQTNFELIQKTFMKTKLRNNFLSKYDKNCNG